MRYSMAVTPKNYLLFACHFVNFGSQLTQGYRWYDYHYQGGNKRWEVIREQAKAKAAEAEKELTGVVNQVEGKVNEGIEKVKSKVS